MGLHWVWGLCACRRWRQRRGRGQWARPQGVANGRRCLVGLGGVTTLTLPNLLGSLIRRANARLVCGLTTEMLPTRHKSHRRLRPPVTLGHAVAQATAHVALPVCLARPCPDLLRPRWGALARRLAQMEHMRAQSTLTLSKGVSSNPQRHRHDATSLLQATRAECINMAYSMGSLRRQLAPQRGGLTPNSTCLVCG